MPSVKAPPRVDADDRKLDLPCYLWAVAHPSIRDDGERSHYDPQLGDVRELNKRHRQNPHDRETRQKLYDHPYTKPSHSEVNNRSGVTIFEKHNLIKGPLGRVVKSAVGRDGRLMSFVEVTDRDTKRKVYNGEYKGVSMGYERSENDGQMVWYDLSLTDKPFFEDSVITHIASDDSIPPQPIETADGHADPTDRPYAIALPRELDTVDPFARILYGNDIENMGIHDPFAWLCSDRQGL